MKTYKVKLMFDCQEVYDFWVGQLCMVRDCFNYASKIIYDEKLTLSLKPLHKRLYYELREKFDALPSQMCISIERALIANYKSCRTNGAELTSPIEMKNPAIQLDKRLYSGMTQESFKISNGIGNKRSVVKFQTYPKFRELSSKYRMCDPKLTYNEKSGEFFACVPFLTLDITPKNNETVGIDIGIKRLATLSTGVAYSEKKYLANRRKIRHNKRMLKKHKKHSHSARTKLKNMRRHERNVSNDMCHRLANQILATKASILVMEDLSGIKRSTARTKSGFKRTGHNRRIGQVPFYKLKTILTYKAPLVGKRVETVPPEYTSQEDCRSQSKEGCRRVGCRFYAADGRVFDADWNAALNIRNRYRPCSLDVLPIDGTLDLRGRSRQLTDRRTASDNSDARQAHALQRVSS